MSAEDRIERSRLLYERAVYGGDVDALATADRELDAVEADLALARGRVIHTRFLAQLDEKQERLTEDPRELALFERAMKLYRELGDVRGEGESLFWVGCFHQVVRQDDETAVPILEQSYELGSQVGDKRTMSEALRHLGIAEHRAGRLETARQRLEESVRLRRDIGLMPGVAANMVGLAYIAAGDGDHDEALALLKEAGATPHCIDFILTAGEVTAESAALVFAEKEPLGYVSDHIGLRARLSLTPIAGRATPRPGA